MGGCSGAESAPAGGRGTLPRCQRGVIPQPLMRAVSSGVVGENTSLRLNISHDLRGRCGTVLSALTPPFLGACAPWWVAASDGQRNTWAGVCHPLGVIGRRASSRGRARRARRRGEARLTLRSGVGDEQFGHLLGRFHPSQRLAGAAVEFASDLIKRVLVMDGQVGALGQVLAQQPVGVLV